MVESQPLFTMFTITTS